MALSSSPFNLIGTLGHVDAVHLLPNVLPHIKDSSWGLTPLFCARRFGCLSRALGINLNFPYNPKLQCQILSLL